MESLKTLSDLRERFNYKMNNLFFIFIWLLILSCGCKEKGGKMAPPNILLILTDDQGYGDLHFHGNDSISTPNLDQLAQQSIRFDRFYVSPVCAPTRASLLTGRYHLRTGTSWVTHRKEVLRSEEMTIAELLKANGYATGCFGKWHNGEQYPNDPSGQGFDEFFGFAAGHWNNYFNTTLQHNGRKEKTKGFITDVLTDKAIDFMEKNKNQPFFCYVPYNAPHSPFQVPDKYFDKYKQLGLTDKNASVYGMVENIDDNVGRLLQTLDSLSISNNTIVIFMTDNGPNGRRFNGGMRGTKASVHEGGVRVPCFFRWPSHLKENVSISTITSHIDVLPTLADLCHIPLPDSLHLDGVSLLPLMKNSNAKWPARTICSIQNDGENRKTRGSARTDQYRFVLDDNGNQHLYNMLEDPAESNNLAATLPEITDSIFNLYKNWFADVTANQTIVPIPVGHKGHPSVFLPAPEAKISAGLTFQGSMGWANDYIINWQKGGMAVWDLGIVTGGNYEVLLHCNYQQFREAVFSVGKLDFEFSAKKDFYPNFYPSPDRLPRGEVFEKDWDKILLGEIGLKKGKSKLQLILKESGGGTFELKGLELTKK